MKIDRIIKIIYKLTDDRLETKICIIIFFFFSICKKILWQVLYLFIYLFIVSSPSLSFFLDPSCHLYATSFFLSFLFIY